MSRSTRRSIRRSRRSKRGGASRSNRASNGNRRAKSIRGGELLVATDFSGDFSYTRKKDGFNIYKLTYKSEPKSLTFDFNISGAIVQNMAGNKIKSESANRFMCMAAIPPTEPGTDSLNNIINMSDLKSLVVTINPTDDSTGVTVTVTNNAKSTVFTGRNTFAQVIMWLVDANNAVDVAKPTMMNRMGNSMGNMFGTKPAAAATSV